VKSDDYDLEQAKMYLNRYGGKAKLIRVVRKNNRIIDIHFQFENVCTIQSILLNQLEWCENDKTRIA